MKLLDPRALEGLPLSPAQARVRAFVQHGAGAIGNVATRMAILETSEHGLPVSINDGDEPAGKPWLNSYVVSPLTAYIGYAQFEIRQLGRPWLTWPLGSLVAGLGGWLARARIDRIVQVNNWLLSTNLYPPDWDGRDLPALTGLLTEAFPDHAIGFRSLNRHSNAGLLDRLLDLGYLSVPSRQVYLFDGRAGEGAPYLARRDSRKDARHLARSPYRQVPGEALAEADYPRLEQLYNLLYLDKYCPLNPQFSADWLRAGQRDGWLELTALRSPEGSIDGVLGWFANTAIMTTPVVGYDTALPQELGLYRLISQISLERAARSRRLLNMSAGAAHFKRLRGGQAEIETSLVYVRHLPAQRQRAWRMLSRVLHRVGVPVMRRFKL